MWDCLPEWWLGPIHYANRCICEIRAYTAKWTHPTIPSTRSVLVRKTNKVWMWGARSLSVEDSSNHQVCKIVNREFSSHRHKNGIFLLSGIYLIMPWNHIAHIWRKCGSSFSKLDNTLKNWHDNINQFWSQSKLIKAKKIVLITHARGKTKSSFHSFSDTIIKLLSCTNVITEYPAKKCSTEVL